MDTIIPLKPRTSERMPVNNQQLLELIDYLLSLRENNFTGHLSIDFKRGVINQIAFNQKSCNCYDLSVNE